MVIDGKLIAKGVIDELKQERRPEKILAAVLVGDNLQSKSFLKQKEKTAQELGIKFQLFQFDEAISEKDLIQKIEKINADDQIGGIIVQLPLPKQYNRNKILTAIESQKDIEALTSLSVEVVKEILKVQNHNAETSMVAVVGQGFLTSKPIVEWLRGRCKKLIIVDIGDDLSQIKEADLVITGVGKAGLIKPEMLKRGSRIIDFGYDTVDGRIRGDFDANNSDVSWYSPTPGGTGPILVAMLFKNFYLLNYLK